MFTVKQGRHGMKKVLLAAALCYVFAVGAEPLSVIKLTDRHGTLVKDAVVVFPNIKSKKNTTSTVNIDQVNRQFQPHVSAIRINSLVNFPNSDDTRHHVYSFSPAKKFELKLYRKNEAKPVLFDKPGLVTLGCNIHDSMLAYVFITESEVFGVSNEKGEVYLPSYIGRLPNYFKVWHPQLNDKNPLNQKLTSPADSGTLAVKLPFEYNRITNIKKQSSLKTRLQKFKRNEN